MALLEQVRSSPEWSRACLEVLFFVSFRQECVTWPTADGYPGARRHGGPGLNVLDLPAKRKLTPQMYALVAAGGSIGSAGGAKLGF